MSKIINLYSKSLKLQRFADPENISSAQGLASTGTKLEMAEVGSTDYVEVADVKTIPALGGAPQEIDVTTLSDTRTKQIEGIEAATTAAFLIQYKGPSWNTVHAKAGDRKQYNWRVTYPDDMKATFTGSFTIQFGEATVNGSLTYTMTITISDGPDMSDSPTTGASKPVSNP